MKFKNFNFYENYKVRPIDLLFWFNSFYPYNADQKVFDLSRNHNNLYSVCGHTTPYLTYKSGCRFYYFDGIDDFLYFESEEFKSSIFTIGTWLFLRNVENQNFICYLGNLGIYFKDGLIHFISKNFHYIGEVPFELNTWVFLSLVVNDSSFKVFINTKVLKLDKTSSDFRFFRNSKGFIGSYIDGLYPLKGSISSFFYMNRVMDSTGISQIYSRDRGLYSI